MLRRARAWPPVGSDSIGSHTTGMLRPDPDMTRTIASTRALGAPSLRAARPLRLTRLAALASLASLGCDPDPAPADAATLDAPSVEDAPTPLDDAADDAGNDAATQGLDAGPTRCLSPSTRVDGSDVLEHALGRVQLSIEGDRDACRRTYLVASSGLRRDDIPGSPRRVIEREDGPALRTGHDLFDALFALALDEAHECSVGSIEDYAFDMGRALPCPEGGCFETGRLWKYVWTRDTSYSVDLSLAALDPTRSLNSMLFKLSERRGGGGEQIVQDTGTGGSYPVSSDRVVWALGADALLGELEGSARTALRDRAYAALVRTIAHDRDVVFDSARGLYRGESSFLDWREQSYPDFTREDVGLIAQSESLSTNVLHLHAIELAARLAAERGELTEQARLAADATALRARIREAFWSEARGELLAFTPGQLDRAAVTRLDLLGTSLAILDGVVSADEGRRALSAYPHFERGAPVIAPQQQRTAIYHNRGQWPFVTAYELMAARRVRHPAAATHAVRTLWHSAALSLSNMENYEVPTGLPWREDGAYSGPVVNSQRQLWSVAGYLGMVARALFGVSSREDGVHVAPYLTADLVADLFAGQRELVLERWPVRGREGVRRAVTVVLHLPSIAASAGRDLEVLAVRLDGVPVSGVIAHELLREESRIDVDLIAASDDGPTPTLNSIDEAADWRETFGPLTPRIASLEPVGGQLRLSFDLAGEAAADVQVTVYRDGVRVAGGLTDGGFTDTGWDVGSPRTPCYAIEACFVASGTCSQHSAAACWWGAGAARARTYGTGAFTATGGVLSADHGRSHYGSWGDPGDRLSIVHTAAQSGEHLVQLTYGNGAAGISTGITCAVKRVLVEDLASGAIVSEGVVVMPQLGTWSRWADSTFARVELEAGRSYRISIFGDDGTVNMSSFQHFASYTAGAGGSAPFARVNVAEIKVLAR